MFSAALRVLGPYQCGPVYPFAWARLQLSWRGWNAGKSEFQERWLQIYQQCLEKSVVVMTGAGCQPSGCPTVRVPNLRLTGRLLFGFFSRPGCAAGAAYACSVTKPQWGLQLPPQMLCRCKPVRPTPCGFCCGCLMVTVKASDAHQQGMMPYGLLVRGPQAALGRLGRAKTQS